MINVYNDKKILIAEKINLLFELWDKLSLEEIEDAKNIVTNAQLIINGKYDSLDYVVQEDKFDTCINALNNMISKYSKRK